MRWRRRKVTGASTSASSARATPPTGWMPASANFCAVTGFIVTGMTETSANVVSFLARSAARVPDRVALIERDTAVTFAELWRRVNATAAGLQRAGVRPGD